MAFGKTREKIKNIKIKCVIKDYIFPTIRCSLIKKLVKIH
jgi:hypothetical protein